jgi:anthranilate/para-aminobenzoate synthase component II
MHGRASTITHDGKELFAGIPSPMQGGRYHSLMCVLEHERELQVTARCTDGNIMALRHVQYPTFGVQFHPESVLTDYGMVLVRNFSIITKCWHRMQKVAA